MEKFHITITENETGKTLIDTDTAAIIGAHDHDDLGTAVFSFTGCNSSTLAATCAAAKKAANKTALKLPKNIRRMIDRLSKITRKEAKQWRAQYE